MKHTLVAGWRTMTDNDTFVIFIATWASLVSIASGQRRSLRSQARSCSERGMCVVIARMCAVTLMIRRDRFDLRSIKEHCNLDEKSFPSVSFGSTSRGPGRGQAWIWYGPIVSGNGSCWCQVRFVNSRLSTNDSWRLKSNVIDNSGWNRRELLRTK
jgi:hypothetical protein